MTYPQQSFGGHPVAGFLHAASADAAKVADMPLWSLSDAEVGELLTVAARVEAQVAALKLGLVAEAHARDLAGRAGVPSTQAWLRSQLRVTPQAAKGQVTLAGALRGLDATRVALAEGRVSVAHARVVADAVAELPEQVGDQVRERAESHLVGCAGEFDPQQLAKLGRWSTPTPPTPGRPRSSPTSNNVPGDAVR